MSATTTLETARPVATQTILERSVCLVLTCGYLGNHRKVEMSGMQVEQDGERLRVEMDELRAGKKLFASRDLRGCEHAIASVKSRLRAMSVDGGTRIFGTGAYLIPILSVAEAERVLEEGQALVARNAGELAQLLPRIIEQRREKLGRLFRLSDYPTADEVLAAYRIGYNFVSFGAPERLEEVDPAAYSRAVAKHEGLLAAAYDDVVLGLRQSAALVVRELAARLSPGADGKPKALRETALRDLQDLLQRLPVLNSIGEDEALAATLARVGVLAEGMDVDTLRRQPGVRAMLLEEATAVAAQLDHLVTSGRRHLELA